VEECSNVAALGMKFTTMSNCPITLSQTADFAVFRLFVCNKAIVTVNPVRPSQVVNDIIGHYVV